MILVWQYVRNMSKLSYKWLKKKWAQRQWTLHCPQKRTRTYFSFIIYCRWVFGMHTVTRISTHFCLFLFLSSAAAEQLNRIQKGPETQIFYTWNERAPHAFGSFVPTLLFLILFPGREPSAALRWHLFWGRVRLLGAAGSAGLRQGGGRMLREAWTSVITYWFLREPLFSQCRECVK